MSIERSPYDEAREESRREKLEDAAGFTPERSRLLSPDAVIVGSQAMHHMVEIPERVHHSRRGGRAYNEGSDSDYDPNWTVQPEPLSADDAATMHEAIEAQRAAERARKEQEIDMIFDPVEREKARVVYHARLRAKAEKAQDGRQ